MVLPTELNLPGIEEDFPDDMTPRPFEDLLGEGDMPPPPMIQIASFVPQFHLGFRHDDKVYQQCDQPKEVAMRPLWTGVV